MGYTFNTREGNILSFVFFLLTTKILLDSVSHEAMEIFSFQKEKRRKWIFGKLKTKKLPSITAPLKETTICEAVEEQSKHGLTVAIASATAVKVAAEVVLLDSEESQLVETRSEASESIYKCQTEIKESAAIKIQTAFRGYLVSF